MLTRKATADGECAATVPDSSRMKLGPGGVVVWALHWISTGKDLITGCVCDNRDRRTGTCHSPRKSIPWSSRPPHRVSVMFLPVNATKTMYLSTGG